MFLRHVSRGACSFNELLEEDPGEGVVRVSGDQDAVEELARGINARVAIENRNTPVWGPACVSTKGGLLRWP